MAAMEMLIDQPGPIILERINAADWAVPLAGLVNLKRPEAVQAGLQDRDEPIQIYVHRLEHPTQGSYLVDTGVSKPFVDSPSAIGIPWFVAQAMGLEKLVLRNDTATVVERLAAPLHGVFLTHMHIDHIAGMPAIPADTPLYIGPGETTVREAMNWPVRGTTDRLLHGKAALQEWQFPATQGDELPVVDVFGDGYVFAISVPGHTPGSVAYLARTPQGPVLLTGDTCHTRWGWDNGVEPGKFTRDNDLNLEQLKRLKALASRHPKMAVWFGHQR
jgi:glyoxylase-like metal-dependent hydrolase (beta-lactamase superfamily II)